MFDRDDVDEELQRGFGLSIDGIEPLLQTGGDAAEMKFMECCRYLWQAEGAELIEPLLRRSSTSCRTSRAASCSNAC